MDRCAIFVDAGDLFAEGGKLCCGTRSRHLLLLDAAEVVEVLGKLAMGGSGLPVLRTYWYDGAKGGVPTTAQQLVSALPNVKLRLGRLNARMEQKGVDALIYRDLMTLARERAISDAYLLSGDEDLREGVRSAQDMGVRVTLVGIAPTGKGFNQSRDLVHEADEIRTIDRAALAPALRKRNPPPPGTPVSVADPLSETRLAAKNFALQWSAKASAVELTNLHADEPRIPHLLDLELVQAIEHHLGPERHMSGQAPVEMATHSGDIRRAGRGARRAVRFGTDRGVAFDVAHSSKRECRGAGPGLTASGCLGGQQLGGEDNDLVPRHPDQAIPL